MLAWHEAQADMVAIAICDAWDMRGFMAVGHPIQCWAAVHLPVAHMAVRKIPAAVSFQTFGIARHGSDGKIEDL